MNADNLCYFSFPYLVLSESDYRHLSILVPQLFFLQIDKEPNFPQWETANGGKSFAAWPVVGEEDLKQIRLYLKGYQQFADLHGEGSLLAFMSHERSEKEIRESRFSIQKELRGRESGRADAEKWPLYEAAIFTEMARDLDARELELVGDFSRLESLERQFREIVGIADEEETDALEVVEPVLTPDRSHLSFMLDRRIAFWLRLFSFHPPEGSPALVTVHPNVVDETVDPVASAQERAGKDVRLSRIPLISLPTLEHLQTEAFQTLLGQLRTSDNLSAYWHSLEGALKDPTNPSSIEALNADAAQLLAYVEGFCRTVDALGQRQVSLTLIHSADFTLHDIREALEKGSPAGSQREGDEGSPQNPVSILLCE